MQYFYTENHKILWGEIKEESTSTEKPDSTGN